MKKEEKNRGVILLIMNCYRYENKAEQQKKKWLTSLPSFIRYYHVLGNPLLETDFFFDEEERKLIVKTEDDYNSLPKKVIAAYQAVYQTQEFSYLFKTDDDQMLIQPKFLDTLYCILSSQQKEKKHHYGGNIVNVKKAHLSSYHLIHPELPKNLPVQATKYCNGRFYFLSYESVVYLMSQRENIEKEYFEDYAVGYYMHSYFKTNMLNLQTDKYFIDYI